jgi:hypothetical protein
MTHSFSRNVPLALIGSCLSMVFSACSKQPEKAASAPPPAPAKVTAVKVVLNNNGPIVLSTDAAEFQILPSGYVRASLVKGGKRLTLDEPPSTGPADSEYVVSGGKDVHFVLDFSQARVSEASGKMGLGKRVDIPGHAAAPSGEPLANTVAFEVYDSFPTLLVTSAAYRNTGNSPINLDKVITQNRRLDASATGDRVQP